MMTRTQISDLIKSHTKEITWLPSLEVGWGNGYVELPKGHPWYGKDYDDIEVDVHGGLTYATMKDEHWVIGFDCAHLGDNKTNCSKKFVEEETERLRQKAISAWLRYIKPKKTELTKN